MISDFQDFFLSVSNSFISGVFLCEFHLMEDTDHHFWSIWNVGVLSAWNNFETMVYPFLKQNVYKNIPEINEWECEKNPS